MRRTFFCLLMLLTALRGMVGDAMALEMSRMHAGADGIAVQAAHHSDHEPAAFPCHEADASSPELGGYAGSECHSCQICHSPALQRIHLNSEPNGLIAHGDPLAESPWMSADPAPAQKPPIF
jgi:hypothetical protein